MFELFRHQTHYQTRWISFENPRGEKGGAARENRGAKGHPCEIVYPGQQWTLLDLRGAGMVTRIWLSFDNQSTEMLRSLRLEMYWDDAKAPAVSAPLGDFFGN